MLMHSDVITTSVVALLRPSGKMNARTAAHLYSLYWAYRTTGTSHDDAESTLRAMLTKQHWVSTSK